MSWKPDYDALPTELRNHEIEIIRDFRLKEAFMNQEQFLKAANDRRTELEYLSDSNQWIPAAIKQHYPPGSSHSPAITIQLLQHPRNHPGIIHLNANDVKQRLRLKSSN